MPLPSWMHDEGAAIPEEYELLEKMYGQDIRMNRISRSKLQREPYALTRQQANVLMALARQSQGCVHPPPSLKPRRAKPAHDGAQVTIDQDDPFHTKVNAKGQDLVQNLEDLLKFADIDLNEWRVARHRVNTWTTPMKIKKKVGENANGEPITVDVPSVVRNWQVRADLDRRIESLVELDANIRVRNIPRVVTPSNRSEKLALYVPDSQHGYRWSDDRRELIPLHDERACDLIVQAVKHYQPDEVILLGDMLDLAEWSNHWPVPAQLLHTTQPTLQRIHDWLADIRKACPSARIVFVEGNHEARIRKLLVDKMGHGALNVRAVGDDQPALSLPRLLNLGALDVEYVGPYGESYYIEQDTRITHGDKVRQKGGATVKAVLEEAHQTTWFGHVHRRAIASRTLHDHTGQREISAATPGCLCLRDGSTPGVTLRPDWQHGYGLQWWVDGGHFCEVRSIVDGKTMIEGRQLVGEDVDSMKWAA